MALAPAALAPDRVPVVALLVGSVVSLAGSTLTRVALPWFVLSTTGSAVQTGLVGVFQVLPALLAGVFGGAVVDRLGYRRTSVAADALSALGVALVPLLYATVGLAFWQLLALVFAGNLLTIPGLTARRALLPELAARAGMRLERVNGLFETAQYVGLLVGPPVAGLLVVTVGARNVLWFDAASFAVSALVVFAAVPSLALTAPATGRYWDSLVAGLRFLWGDRVLRAMVIALACANFLGNGLYAVMLPVYAQAVYNDATVLGLIFAASGAGQVIGGVLYGLFGHRVSRAAIWMTGFGISASGYWALAAGAPLGVLLATQVIAGVLGAPLNPLMVTIRHERIPPEMRGRVFGTYSAVAMSAIPLGILLAGVATESFGVRVAAFAFALASQGVSVVMLLTPTLRRLDATRHVHAASP